MAPTFIGTANDDDELCTTSDEKTPRQTTATETARGGRQPIQPWDFAWLKERLKRIAMWNRIEPYLPAFPEAGGHNSSADYLVGMALHCFILSVFVLSVAGAKALKNLFLFACYIALHYAVYKGDVIPISEDGVEPVTIDQVNEATIFNASGLKVIIAQNRPPLPSSTSGMMSTKSAPRDCESNSSQDVSNIFSCSSKCGLDTGTGTHKVTAKL